MITVKVDNDRPFGVLDNLPSGFSTSKAAMERLRSVLNENYGVAGYAFISHLVKSLEENEAKLRERIARYISEYEADVGASALASVRETRNFSMISAAGRLAQRWKIIPKSWGSIADSCRRVQTGLVDRPLTPIQRAQGFFQSYMNQNSKGLTLFTNETTKVSFQDLTASAGFLIGSQTDLQLVIPTTRFDPPSQDFKSHMRTLRKYGLTKTEGGSHKKFSVKTPRAICEKGRFYCILIGKFAMTGQNGGLTP